MQKSSGHPIASCELCQKAKISSHLYGAMHSIIPENINERQYVQDKLYNTDKEKLYKKLESSTIDVDRIPMENQEEMETFWKQIWEVKTQHDEQTVWLKRNEDRIKTAMTWEEIKEDEDEPPTEKLQG
ncbi:hypothetical protein ILUMI_21494 [Ignelater luminosus]|uniref:Uncharacterized protein n=1 Tax=Ignelater luminosus TaxID=2038154 RepID=A0A8K0G1D5_IGNLU|nr:hypothetical protein ILUMI_21494 [Ignelater luminosus]